MAFLTFISVPVVNGLLPAANRYIPTHRSLGESSQVSRWVTSTRTLSFGFAFPAMLLILVFSRWIAEHLLGNASQVPYILLSAVSIPFTAYSLTERTLIQSFQQINLWSIITLALQIAGLALMASLVGAFGLHGALGQIALVGLLGGILGTLLYRWFRGDAAEPLLQLNFNPQIVRQLTRFGGASLMGSAFISTTFLVIRTLIITRLGAEAAGIYQAVSSISLQYLAIGLFSMSVYWYPHLAEITDSQAIVGELNKFLRLSLTIMTPLLALLMLLRTPVIELVYSARFLEASPLLPIQMIGDFLYILFWVTSVHLLPMAKIKAYLVVSVGYNLTLLLVSWLLLERFGLTGGILARALVNGIWAAINFVVQRKLIGFQMIAPNLRLIVFSFVILYGSFLLGGGSFSFTGLMITLIALAMWALLSSTAAERTLVMHPRSLLSKIMAKE